MFIPAHALVQEAKKSVTELPAADIHQHLQTPGALIIDVREPDEYRQGHIPGAINMPRGVLEFRISGEPALQNLERPIVIYCKTSGRAALSAVALQAMGFRAVISLAGGFDAWVAGQHAYVRPREIAFE